MTQNIMVSGQVLEASSNEPLPGASVVQKGTSNGVTSDFDGNFSIEVPSGSTLVVSYVGFIPKEVSVSSTSPITIQLQEDVASLEEVVVIGYGTQKKKEITGAVSVISSETIEELKPVAQGETVTYFGAYTAPRCPVRILPAGSWSSRESTARARAPSCASWPIIARSGASSLC